MCDDKGPTLTIVKTARGNVFGGYTDLFWYGGSINYDIGTGMSFIFKMNPDKSVSVSKPKDINSEIYGGCINY